MQNKSDGGGGGGGGGREKEKKKKRRRKEKRVFILFSSFREVCISLLNTYKFCFNRAYCNTFIQTYKLCAQTNCAERSKITAFEAIHVLDKCIRFLESILIKRKFRRKKKGVGVGNMNRKDLAFCYASLCVLLRF